MTAQQQQMVPQPQQPPQQSLAQPTNSIRPGSTPYGGPMVILTYGPSGLGKTVADMYSFGPVAHCVGEPGGFRVASTVCGIQPPVTQILRINDATALIAQGAGKFGALVIDDFSLVADVTFSLTEQVANGFTLFASIRAELLMFRHTARRANYCHVAVNAHERPPHLDQLTKNLVLGGPRLPGRMSEELPGAFDSILRVVPAPWKGQPLDAQDGVPPLFKLGWPYVFEVGLNPMMVTKDRLDIIQQGIGPMNSAEMLRARGYAIPRLASVPWQEEMVEAIAQRCLPMVYGQAKLPDYLAILGECKAIMTNKLKARAQDIIWTMRDAIARTWIRYLLAQRSMQLYGV